MIIFPTLISVKWVSTPVLTLKLLVRGFPNYVKITKTEPMIDVMNKMGEDVANLMDFVLTKVFSKEGQCFLTAGVLLIAGHFK